ncbi:MAG: serine hydrolase [Pseudomonadota bacterium]
MLKKTFAALLLAACSAAWSEPSLRSAHVLVLDESTGEVLLEKDAGTPAPIASMTKLMTAMVVLDARLPYEQKIRIDRADLDTLKHTQSGVPVGSVITREDLITLALISSDNRAAAALARTYPGGRPAFQAAVNRKIRALELEDTVLVEPTGLSPRNRASARDMAKILQAAAAYPEIAVATSQRRDRVVVNGRTRVARNTNGLVGAPGWSVLASKTGFTREAGRCVSMRLEAAGRKVLVVLMGAVDSSKRTLDAINIHRWLGSEPAQRVASDASDQQPRAARKVSASRPSAG